VLSGQFIGLMTSTISPAVSVCTMDYVLDPELKNVGSGPEFLDPGLWPVLSGEIASGGF
jgi:hypothetical protein